LRSVDAEDEEKPGILSPLSAQNLAPKRSDICAGTEAVIEGMVEDGTECGVLANQLCGLRIHRQWHCFSAKGDADAPSKNDS